MKGGFRRSGWMGNLFLALTCLPQVVWSGEGGRLALYSDAEFSHCTLVDTSPQTADVYLVHKIAGSSAQGDGVLGILYLRLASSPGFTGTWLEDVLPAGLGSVGTSQSGISIGYDICQHSEIMALRVRYQMQGTSSPCSFVEAVSSSNACCIVTSTCFWGEEPVVDGSRLLLNADESCPCDVPVATEASTWGRIKAMYRD